jgi:gliding motility-associated lipoprotein GldD
MAALAGCDDPPVPKPRGYHRIEFPAFEYAPYAHPCGVSFEVPVYSKIERIERGAPEAGICWFNCAFPRFSAKLHCTLMPVDDKAEFASLVEDAHQMVFSHEMKAAGIRTQRFDFPEHQVGGVLYNLQGPVASPIQFFATDSTAHFLRGSLYFDHTPNPDSLKPSLTHIEQDIVHLIETLAWTESAAAP